MQVDPTTPVRWNEGIKRSRSISPSNNKRRVPSNYTPSIYTHLPQHLMKGFPHLASSPIDSWVTRTEGLVLVTPDSGSPPVFDAGYIENQENEMMSQEMDRMDSDDIEQPHSTLLPLTPLSLNSIQAATIYNNQLSNKVPLSSLPSSLSAVIAPPHQLPSLYSNLAGSPTSSPLSRSANNSSEDHNMNVTFLGERVIDDEMNSNGGNGMTARMSMSGQQLNYSSSSFQEYGAAGGHKQPRISMGFRADCLKCLARVPGHYSHLI